MTRSVFRYVRHRMTRHPDTDTTATAECMTLDCGWESLPTSEAEHCEVQCMTHTGLTGHVMFRRRFEDIAVVERTETPAR